MKILLLFLLLLLFFGIGYYLMSNLDRFLNEIVQERHDIADRYSFDTKKKKHQAAPPARKKNKNATHKGKNEI